MEQESVRYDGDNVTLYRIDTDEDVPLYQQRFDGIHTSPVEHDGEVYLFVHSGESSDAVSFETVCETFPGYDVGDSGAVEQLDGEDIDTDALPDDVYGEIRETVEDRGFAVASLAEVYQESDAAEAPYDEDTNEVLVPPMGR